MCVWGAGEPSLLVQKLTRKLSMSRVVKHCLPSYAGVHLFGSSKNLQKAKAHHSARPAQPSGQGISPCPRLCNWIAGDDWAIPEDINQLILSTH